MLSQPRLTEVQFQLVQFMLDNDVRFVVIGGHAMRANGATERQTKDLDVILDVDQRSATALAKYFKTFNPGLDVMRLALTMTEERHQKMPFGPYGVHEVDLLTKAKGIPFSELMSQPAVFGDQVLPVVLRLEVIRLKELVLDSVDPDHVKQKHRDDIELLKRLELIERQERVETVSKRLSQ
jgi:hypothetical protein